MEYKDYYKVLGVERTATQDQIKSAYRKLARKYHPDVNKEAGAEDRFKEVGEANDVLGDPEKRAAYDQLGSTWKAGQDFTPPPNWDAGFEYSEHAGAAGPAGSREDFSDFFEAVFGRQSRRSTQRSERAAEFHARGEDHHARIVVDVRDVFEGAQRAVSLRVPQLDADGHVSLRERTLNVTIPKGILEGQHIRLKGQGGPGAGKLPAGDLYLEVEYKTDPVYRVHGRDLYIDLPVTPWETALGGSVRVSTPQGDIMLKVPANSQSGRELRVKGRGIPSAEPGDLYAVLKIVTPPATTPQLRSAYEELSKAAVAYQPRKHLES